jgi:two-component system, response regulator PdtaR
VTKKRILIVEDEPITAMDESSLVASDGYEVVGIARSGEAAIQMALKFRPDLILMDLMLDDAISGNVAADEICAKYDVPIIYVTAFGNKEQSKDATPPDGVGYIVKPYSEKELLDEIHRLLP